MSGLLGHVDIAPIFLGVLLAICVLTLLKSFTTGKFLTFAIEAGTWYLVFITHPGVQSAIAASVAAFIVGRVYRVVLRRKS